MIRNLVWIGVLLSIFLYCNRENPNSNPIFFTQPLPLFKEKTFLEVSFINARVIEKNHIGDEWSLSSIIDGNRISIGETKVYDVSHQKSLKITSVATEEDPNHDDEGIGIIEITPTNIKQLLVHKHLVDTIEVHEYYGPGAGNTAICTFTYAIETDSLAFKDFLSH